MFKHFPKRGVKNIYPFFYLFCGLIAGLIYTFGEGVIWQVTALTAIGVLFYISRSKLILFAGFIAGLMLIPVYDRESGIDIEEAAAAWEGKVISSSVPAGREDNVRFVFLSNDGMKLHVYSSEPAAAGEHCRITGEVAPVKTPVSPYQFDYAAYLKGEGVSFQLFADEIECVSNQSYYYSLLEKRETFIKDYNAETLETRALFTALVFGERRYIQEDRIALYQRLGVIHLLAVSGLHVGIVSGAVWFLLVRLGLTKQRAAVIILLLMPAYILFAGAAPSVMRSGIMMMAGLGLWLMKVKIPLLEVCSLTGVCLLIFNPHLLLHIGFQLSFLTSLSLILSRNLLQSSGFSAMLKMSAVAQLVSLPMVLFHFYEVSLLSIAANAVFIPLISLFILPASFAAVFTYHISDFITGSIEIFSEILLLPAHTLLEWMSERSFHMMSTGAITPLTAFFVLCTVILMFLTWERKKYCALSAALFFSSILYILYSPYLDDTGYIHFLNVGQGDAVLIELPKRKAVYMIDTGGEIYFSDQGVVISENGPGKRIIEPFLKGRGITQIDKLILTHGHLDHIGEVCYLTERIPIEKVLYPYSESLPEEAKNQFACLEDKQIPVSYVHAADEWSYAGHHFDIVHPMKKTGYDENDLSIVLNADISGVKFLFTGDIEQGAEEEIVNRAEDIQAEILKAAHHGSSTSSTPPFVEKVNAAAAVISAGENNRYGHPSAETLQTFEEHGLEIFRTDEDGTVTISVKDGVWEAVKFIE